MMNDSIVNWLDELPFHFITAFREEYGEGSICIKIMPKKEYQLFEDINFPDNSKKPDWQSVTRGKLLLIKRANDLPEMAE